MSQLIISLRDKLLRPGFMWSVILMLSLISMLAVYSTSVTLTQYNYGSTGHFIMRHVVFVLSGIGLVWVFSRIDYIWFNRWAVVMLWSSVILLIIMYYFGVRINDATRWLVIPVIGVTFQVSDFARLALILYLARAISEKQDVIKGFKSAFLPIMGPILLICGLIAPSNLSTAIIIFAGALAMMFVGRIQMKYIAMVLMLGVAVFLLLLFVENLFPGTTRAETWVSRIQSHFYGTEDTYQLEQAKMAIANGNLLIPNPGNSQLKAFIPYSYADFIYPIICEEYGLIIGGFGIILIYLALLVHCVGIVSNSKRAFGALLTMGVGVNLVLQAFANIAVSLGLIPVTGLPLPFVSMGGTSLLLTSISLGMVISVSRRIQNLTLEDTEAGRQENEQVLANGHAGVD
ncbi:MAG: FtsW/RodA/SpoVE family cell cycle protein [Saprospiraceae bacterium]|jgi:cell division protein FtsW|nr:FtsW/RodA/SpoVE family cell cycle protein [Saprospiraceae bacterium]MBP9210504.1 FtsW/RodA/SpoVE family cell cycle protein [Saprospiraceae bacterium]MBV6472602.1 putative peptidoglycan glycosyltransferase FtsW [Saprospiraceae bacterium]